MHPHKSRQGLCINRIPLNMVHVVQNCSMTLSEVRLYYFLDGITPDCPNNQTSIPGSTLSGSNLEN